MAWKRVVALVVAIAMVVAAVVVRNRLDAGAGPQQTTADDEPAATTAADPATENDPLLLACISELADVCHELVGEAAARGEQISVAVAEAPATADALTQPSGTLPDAWLTLAPWPEIAAIRGQQAGGSPLVGEPTVLARSPLLLAVWEERATVLTARCGEPLTWRCVGEAAPGTWADVGGPEAWGPVKPGHADPTASATGLLVLGQAAASFHGRADLASQDLSQPAFFAWFTNLERAVPTFRPTSGTPLLAMVQFGPSTFDVVGVVEAVAAPLLSRSADRAATLTLRTTDPAATADVVVVTVGDEGRGDRLVALTADLAPGLLAAAGWRVEGQPSAFGLEPVELPSGNGLPPAGTLEALRRSWLEVTR